MSGFLSAPYRKMALVTAGLPLALISLGLWQWRRAPLAEFETLSRVVSLGAIMVSAVTLGLSLAGLFFFRHLGRETLKSGSVPAANFQKGLSFLSRLMAALGLSLPLGLILAIFYELQYHWLNLQNQSRLEFMLFFFGIMAVLVLAVFTFKLTAAIFTNLRSRTVEPETIFVLGRRVSEAEAPPLWRMARSIAGKTGAAPPEHLVLGLDERFFATEAPVRLNGEDQPVGGRLLYLSLPGLVYLTQDEIRAIIGHELGHFASEDTVHSLSFGPIYAGAVANLKAVDQALGRENFWFHHLAAFPLKLLGEYFLNSFHLAIRQWEREREAAADRAGAAAAGAENLARALLRLAVLGPKIEQVWAEYRAEENLGDEGLMVRLRRAVEEQGLDDPAAYLQTSTPHPTDSHPPISRRLNDLGLEPDSALFERVRDTRATFTALQELGLSDEPAGAWPGLAAVIEEMLAGEMAEQEDMATILLRAAGLNGLERREFHEGFWKMAALLGGGAWLFGAATVWTFGSAAGFVCLAVELVIIFLLGQLLIRRRRPFLTVTAEGFLVGDLDREIPWTAVQYTHVSTDPWTWAVTLALLPDYRPPAFGGDGRCRYRAKDHQIVCSVYNVRYPMKSDDLSRILRGYLRGAQARAELRSRGLSLAPES